MSQVIKFLFLFTIIESLLFPLTSLAAGIYKAGGIDVCYEGLVPCGPGKPYWENGTIVDGKCQGAKVDIGAPCQLCHFFVMGKGILDFALELVIIIAVLMFVYGGFLYMTGGQNPGQMQTAKQVLTSTVIGLIIIFAAWVIVNTVFAFLGLSTFGLSLTGPGKWFQISCPITI